jgi:inorganic pyrophosphatase
MAVVKRNAKRSPDARSKAAPTATTPAEIWKLMRRLFKAHPWHGVPIGEHAPEVVTVYIEIVPTDTVKYELDKETGMLKVDRPQRFSNVCPALYGFLPQTYCGERNGELTARRTGRKGIVGDGDPLDICVITEKLLPRGDLLLQARPIGGLRMIDRGEADDKIIAVLEGDAAYGNWRDIHECPRTVIDRLRHYFLTYKSGPDALEHQVEITHVYDRDEAHEVIRRSQQDYRGLFPDLTALLDEARRGTGA